MKKKGRNMVLNTDFTDDIVNNAEELIASITYMLANETNTYNAQCRIQKANTPKVTTTPNEMERYFGLLLKI